MLTRAELLKLLFKTTTACRASAVSPVLHRVWVEKATCVKGQRGISTFFPKPGPNALRHAHHWGSMPATAQVEPLQESSPETVDVIGDDVAAGDGQPDIFDFSHGSGAAGDGVIDCDDERQEGRGSTFSTTRAKDQW